MTTTIMSNGSKWAGQEPDTIEVLLDVLSRETLEPAFERAGNFIETSDGITRFFGNFRTVSHVFRITSDDNDVVSRLTHAIRANQQTKAYRDARKSMKLRPIRKAA